MGPRTFVYEHRQHPRLIQHAALLGMPIAIVRTAIRAYRHSHELTLNSAASGGIYPSAGVIAGCAAATTWAKVGVVAAIDSVVASIPRPIDCRIRVFIDDVDVAARAPTNRQVVRALASAAHYLVQSLEMGEGAPFSPPKATVVADSPALACHIGSALGPSGGKPCTSVTVLGVDTAAGRSCCAARRSTRAARLARCHTKRARVCRISSAGKEGRAVKFFVAGGRPAATYGAEVSGVAPGALRNLRQLAAHTFRPKARGHSLTTVILLHGGPAGRASYAAAARWALEAWRATAHDTEARSLPYGTNAYDLTRPEARAASWRTARGPISMANLELRRIGWHWPTPVRMSRQCKQCRSHVPCFTQHRAPLAASRHAEPICAAARALWRSASRPLRTSQQHAQI